MVSVQSVLSEKASRQTLSKRVTNETGGDKQQGTWPGRTVVLQVVHMIYISLGYKQLKAMKRE